MENQLVQKSTAVSTDEKEVVTKKEHHFKNPFKSLKVRKILSNFFIYLILIVLSIIWIFPFLWAIFQGFTDIGTSSGFYIVPGIAVTNTGEIIKYGFVDSASKAGWHWSLEPYKVLLGFSSNFGSAKDLDGLFPKWFGNTLIVAIFTTIISTMFVLMVSYALSRFRFKGRTFIMKINLVLGMFPGFLGMIINYWLMYTIGLQGTFWSLIIIYSAGAGMGFYISKGFFDTISKSIDEAAMIDGASRAQIFFKITLPLSKPIIVYTILTSFMGPWGDYITSSYIIGQENKANWTIPTGLYSMISGTMTYGTSYYNVFYAGALLIAIPIGLLFMFMQKYYVSGVTGGSVKG